MLLYIMYLRTSLLFFLPAKTMVTGLFVVITPFIHDTCLSFLIGRVRVYTVTLESELQDHPLFMECIADVASYPSFNASGIVPESNLVLLSGRPSSIGILNWQTKQRASVQMETHPGEPVRSYTVSLRFASFTWL